VSVRLRVPGLLARPACAASSHPAIRTFPAAPNHLPFPPVFPRLAPTAMQVKEDLKTVALGTSKINYLDPRITVAW
jgi:hypothetical protein